MTTTGDQPVPIPLAITRELRLVGSLRFNDETDEVIAALAEHEPGIAIDAPLGVVVDNALHALSQRERSAWAPAQQ